MNSTAKSGKQQSLVDWVSSATKASGSKPVVNGSSNLVGQKRTDTQRLDRENQVSVAMKKPRDVEPPVSEFNAKETL